MIESTFQILPRVGAKKERALWDSGIRKWNDFIDSDEIGPVKPKDKDRFDSLLNYAYDLLDSGDCRGLGNMLKSTGDCTTASGTARPSSTSRPTAWRGIPPSPS